MKSHRVLQVILAPARLERIDRHKSGTTLTPAGTRLLRHARIMTGLWRQALSETSLPAGLAPVCTFGCDREFWHGPGRAFLGGVLSGHPEMAVSVLQGSARDLEDWLIGDLVDVILTRDAIARGSQTVYPLAPERLLLHSDRPDAPVDGDPLYIFVDHGPDFRRQHAEACHGAGIARVSFDSSWWALQTMLERGGSAYLPQSLARPHVEAGRPFVLTRAPVFTRKVNLVVNDDAARNWSWFPPLAARLGAGPSGWAKPGFANPECCAPPALQYRSSPPVR